MVIHGDYEIFKIFRSYVDIATGFDEKAMLEDAFRTYYERIFPSIPTSEYDQLAVAKGITDTAKILDWLERDVEFDILDEITKDDDLSDQNLAVYRSEVVGRLPSCARYLLLM